MKKVKDILLPIYVVLNILYLLVGSFLFVSKIIDIKYFSYGYIILLILNLIISFYIFFKKKYKKNIIDIFLVLIIIFAFISFVFAYKRKIAFFGEWGRYEGLLTICYYISILFLSSFIKEKYKKIVVYSILISGLIELMYGLMQDHWVRLSLVRIIIHRGELYVTGFTSNPNFFGTLMLICLLYSVGLYFGENKIIKKVIYLFLSLLYLIGLLISNTLSSMVGLIFVLIYLIYYSIKNKCFKDYLLITLSMVFLSLIMQVTNNTTLIDDLVKTKNETKEIVKGNLDDDYGTGRVEIWKKTIKIVPKYLITGVGVDNFAYVLDGKPITRGHYLYDKAHNEYLQVLVTMGIFSLFSYLCMHFLVLKNGFKNKKIYLLLPVIGYIIQSLFNISVIEVAPIFYISLGLLMDRG